MVIWYHSCFMVESKLKLHGLGVAKIIAVGSHSLVHGRVSTPQNLRTHYHNLRQLQQIFLPGHIPQMQFLGMLPQGIATQESFAGDLIWPAFKVCMVSSKLFLVNSKGDLRI